MKSSFFSAVSLALALDSARGQAWNAVLKKDKVPSTAREWISVAPNLEYQPAYDLEDSAMAAALKGHRVLSGSTSGYETEFIDGSSTYYNDYAQAWRLLGFYTDCNAPHNNFNECNDGGNNGGGNDGSGDDDDDSTYACQRYLLWAAVSQKCNGSQL